MARNELYSIRLVNDQFRIDKMDRDFNPTGSYFVGISGRECNCFAGNKSTCRHREMVARWRDPTPHYVLHSEGQIVTNHSFREMIESNWWFDFDRERWVKGVEI